MNKRSSYTVHGHLIEDMVCRKGAGMKPLSWFWNDMDVRWFGFGLHLVFALATWYIGSTLAAGTNAFCAGFWLGSLTGSSKP